jgi:FMN-dependent NADH-azoreductase
MATKTRRAPRYVTIRVKEQDGTERNVKRQYLGHTAMVYLVCPVCNHPFYSGVHLWVDHHWEQQKAFDYVREETRKGNGQLSITWGKTYMPGNWKVVGRMK